MTQGWGRRASTGGVGGLGDTRELWKCAPHGICWLLDRIDGEQIESEMRDKSLIKQEQIYVQWMRRSK